MISIILDLIPDDLKSRARDALVDVVAGQADEYLGRDAARSLRGLRSDAAFLRAFDEGLERALQRFVEEYEDSRRGPGSRHRRRPLRSSRTRRSRPRC